MGPFTVLLAACAALAVLGACLALKDRRALAAASELACVAALGATYLVVVAEVSWAPYVAPFAYVVWIGLVVVDHVRGRRRAGSVTSVNKPGSDDAYG